MHKTMSRENIILYRPFDIFVFVELSYDTFTYLTNDTLFPMLQNYFSIFLFCDQIFTHACMVTS
jgi:hypothetical protein